MIEVSHLTKQFAGVKAVDDISFNVQPGEILGFLGPNGAGKTTTMRILACFMPPTTGQATVAGQDVVTRSLTVRRMLGYLPENVPLYPEMRVNEYLKFRAKLKRVPTSERAGRISQVLDQCGLNDVRSKIIGHLSKGYRQRVGLAEAIISNPKLLILDEPTIGLDPNQIRQVRALIKQLGQERTIILSTHILPEVEMICNRVIIINQGRIAAMDTIDGLARTARSQAKINVEIRGPGAEIQRTFENIPGVKNVSREEKNKINMFLIETEDGRDIREAIYQSAVKNKWVLLEMKRTSATLEDLFVKVTARE